MKDVGDIAEITNGVSGFAALINGLILWPIVHSLKRTVDELKAKTSRAPRKAKTHGR